MLQSVSSLSADWRKILCEGKALELLKVVETKLGSALSDAKLCPQKELIFNAFQMEFKNLAAVIIGQDPYHTAGCADGRSFSTMSGSIPQSLKKIAKCMVKDGVVPDGWEPEHGDLSYLQQQGVLLVNCALTTIEGKAGAHKDTWGEYTDAVFTRLAAYATKSDMKLVVMLWGEYAKKKAKFFKKHHVLEAAHPASYIGEDNPTSFVNCGHFAAAKTLLRHCINWTWDQNTAGADQNTAGADQNTAGADQNTAGADQNTAGADQTEKNETEVEEGGALELIPLSEPATPVLVIPALSESAAAPSKSAAPAPLSESAAALSESAAALSESAAPLSESAAALSESAAESTVSADLFAFTDGSCNPNKRCPEAVGGYAVVYDGGELNDVRIYGVLDTKEHYATNMRAEGYAILRCMQYVQQTCSSWSKLTIVSDCKKWVEMINSDMWSWDAEKFQKQENPDITIPLWSLYRELELEHNKKIVVKHMHSHDKDGWSKHPADSFEYKCYVNNDYADSMAKFARENLASGEEVRDLTEYE